MTTTTVEKTTDGHTLSDYFVDIDLASMDIEKGAQILGQLVCEIDGTDETNRIAYLASQLERHVQDLDEAVGKARRAVADRPVCGHADQHEDVDQHALTARRIRGSAF